MSQRELRLLGLGLRAGQVVLGTSGVRAALKRGGLALVVVADGCSARTMDKVVRLARMKRIRTITGPVAGELGRSLGRGELQTVGVCDPRLAAGIGVAGDV
jgi:ribosomal protein L7Ae-like RNA K-turn-binding protein